uniref:Uncharacterized protein n=1 Tax=Papilio xuthus TaxID=66420 RepID=I4DLL2_PAPXU|nr:unknown unsecreted protein [Papilio xuthus]
MYFTITNKKSEVRNKILLQFFFSLCQKQLKYLEDLFKPDILHILKFLILPWVSENKISV